MFYITQKNWNKILGYAEEAYGTEKSEIGGMSVMVEDKDNDWILEEPVILKQIISGGNTVLDKDALADYYTKQAIKMKNKNFRFCWWHSHHTMSAFWSGTDQKAIDEFSEGDFSFALVVNLKGEYKFRVSVWKPLVVHDDTELVIYCKKNKCTKKMAEEVRELCSKPSPVGWNTNRSLPAHRGYRDSYQEAISFNDGYHYNSMETLKQSFTEIVEHIDGINSELIDGTINYKDYSRIIDDLNSELEKEKSLYKINLVKETEIGNLMHILPAQLVVYTASGDTVNDLYRDRYNWLGY